MLGCWNVRGLLAASTYEELNPEDQGLLDAHLSGCARCAEKATAFRAVKSAVPVDPVPLETDLLPSIQRALIEPPASEFVFRPMPMAAGFAALALVGVSAFMLYPFFTTEPSTSADAPASPAASFLEGTFADAEKLEEQRDYTAAYLLLVDGVSSHPGDIRAGEAQQRLADLAFAELKMYSPAFEAYQALRSDYGAVWLGNVERNFMRLNMLEESWRADTGFASLYQLDAARASGEFEDYEELVGQNQLTYVADLAVVEMTQLKLEAADDADGGDYVTAMEAALNSCSNPAAIAMLKYKLADVIRNGDGDLERVQALYEAVAEDETYPALASLAQESLRAMATR
jgi:hypothetical protein